MSGRRSRSLEKISSYNGQTAVRPPYPHSTSTLPNRRMALGASGPCLHALVRCEERRPTCTRDATTRHAATPQSKLAVQATQSCTLTVSNYAAEGLPRLGSPVHPASPSCYEKRGQKCARVLSRPRQP